MSFRRVLIPAAVEKGNAGEHLVMAELLSQGFQAFWADRGNRAFDISVECDGKHSLLRVKTATTGSIPWSVRKNGAIFPDMRDDGDFVVIVAANSSIRDSTIYIVPTSEVDSELRRGWAHYVAHPGRGGKTRKGASPWRLNLYGTPTETNITFGYAERWSEYREAWHLLKPALKIGGR